jgi:hypothetical protein
MKTVMQIALESYKNDGVSFTEWFMDNYEMLLEKEKEQIQNVFEHCWNHPNWKGEYDIKDMNNYINQKK